MFQTSPPKPKQSAPNSKAPVTTHSIVKQIANEPFEIAKVATEQILPNPPQQVQTQNPQPPSNNLDTQKLQRKEARHIQAFREELQEIKKIQQERTNEFRQNKSQTEHEQQQAETQAKQQAPPIDAHGKQQKQGMMGTVKKKVSNMLEAFQFKKPRGTETQKMPSG